LIPVVSFKKKKITSKFFFFLFFATVFFQTALCSLSAISGKQIKVSL
jgi:hypothetical protein